MTSRNTVAIAIWSVLAVAVATSILPLARPTRSMLAVGGLLAGFALLTLSSVLWADSAEKAIAEFNRVTLYLGLFALVGLTARRESLPRWADGLAIGLTAVGLLALASRFFPDLVSSSHDDEFLGAFTELFYPVDYWNGLAILVALAFPLLLRAAVAEGRLLWRGLAVGAIPALAAVVYLTSSRGGVAVALVAVLAFVLLSGRRWAAAGAALVAAAGSGLAVAVLLVRDELVNGPLESAAAAAQGKSAAALTLVVCASTGLAYVLARRHFKLTVALAPGFKRPLAAAAVAMALAGVVAVDVPARFDAFKQPPPTPGTAGPTTAEVSTAGSNGRWQFWKAAVDEFESRPLLGQGAGSYEAWWAQHGSISYFTRQAHSLYLEAAGELGLLGFAMVLGIFGVGIVSAVRRVYGSRAGERATVAAFAALLLGFALAAGIDWMWELTVVGMVGIACLALVTGPATTTSTELVPLRPGGGEAPQARPRRYFGLRVGFILIGLLLIAAQSIPLLAELKIRDSQSALARGESSEARGSALDARRLEPWAASPYLQVALADEQARDFDAARTWIRRAIDKDPSDWRLWVVASRIEGKVGSTGVARRSLDRALALNPRSPLLTSQSGRRRFGLGEGGG